MYSNFKMKKYRYSSVSRTAKKPLVFYNKYREAIASYRKLSQAIVELS